MALLLGFVAGLLLKGAELSEATPIVLWLKFIGVVWVVFLLLLVIPLTSSYLIDVVLSLTKTTTLGKITGYALLVHTLIFLAGMLFTVSLSLVLFEMLGERLPMLTIGNVSPVISENINSGSQLRISGYLDSVTSVQKQLGKSLLVFLVASVVFAFLAGRFLPVKAHSLHQLVKRTAQKSMDVLQLFLLSLPVAVFCLIFPLAVESGFTLVGVAGFNMVVLSVFLLAFLGILYVLVFTKGDITIGTFSRGMLKPQIVAASTRSSLATIPALIETADKKFDIPKSLTAVVIPFFISVFRMNRAISSPFHYIFLIYVYRLELDITNLLMFLGLQILVSFGSPGIPSSGKMTNMPLYLAAGIPMEGYILLKAVDAVPDIFKTLLNVTQVMTVISVVGKKKNWNSVLTELN